MEIQSRTERKKLIFHECDSSSSGCLVKALQSMALKTTFPVWRDSQFADCSYEFHYIYSSIIQRTYSGDRNVRDKSLFQTIYSCSV